VNIFTLSFHIFLVYYSIGSEIIDSHQYISKFCSASALQLEHMRACASQCQCPVCKFLLARGCDLHRSFLIFMRLKMRVAKPGKDNHPRVTIREVV